MWVPFFRSRRNDVERKQRDVSRASLHQIEVECQVLDCEIRDLKSNKTAYGRKKDELSKEQRDLGLEVDDKRAKLKQVTDRLTESKADVDQIKKEISDLKGQKEDAIQSVKSHLITLESQPFIGGL